MRTTTIIIFSVLAGVLVGLGTAYSALTINGWNPELEYIKHADLVKKIIRETKNPDAKAHIETTVFDFGIKDVKEKGKHEFFIKNVGTAPLTLEVNRTTCTCTGIDLSKKRLLPNETCKATLHYDAERATTGHYNQGGIIVTNDPENEEIHLSVTGIFTSPVVLQPGTVVFSSVPASETRSTSIRFYGFEKMPLQIESAEWKDREHFDFTFTPSELSEEDKKDSMLQYASSVYEGTVTVKPGMPVGSFQEKFRLRSNYPSEPVVEFLVRGQISGNAISITGMGYDKESGTIRLGGTSRGQRFSRSFSVQFLGTASIQADLKVKEVKPEWLKTDLSEPRDIGGDTARRRLYTLTLEIPADAPVGSFMGTDGENVANILLETGLNDTPTVRIPIQFAVTN